MEVTNAERSWPRAEDLCGEIVASRQKQPQSAAKGRKQLYLNKAAKFINKMNLAALY